MNKYYLIGEDVEQFSENATKYVMNKIAGKHHATKMDFENGLCFDKDIGAWKPPYFDYFDLASAVVHGAKLMQSTLIERERKQRMKTCTYGVNQIMDAIAAKQMGKETMTIDEVAEVLQELFDK